MFDSSTRSFDFPSWHATRISWFSRGIKTSPGFRPPAIYTGPGTRRDFRRLLRDEEFPSRLQRLAFPNFQPLDRLFLSQRTLEMIFLVFRENDAREYSRLFIVDTLWIDRSMERDLMSIVSRVSWLELFCFVSWNWLSEELVYSSFFLFWISFRGKKFFYFIPWSGQCFVKCIVFRKCIVMCLYCYLIRRKWYKILLQNYMLWIKIIYGFFLLIYEYFFRLF